MIGPGEANLAIQIDALADLLASEAANEQLINNKLLTLSVLKDQFKDEFKEKLSMKELGLSLLEAGKILRSEGSRYFENKEWEHLISDFENGLKMLSAADEESSDKTFQELSKISDQTLQLIEKMAQKKYEEKQYSTAVSLFILLSTMNPLNFNYWYRLGIAYQAENKCLKALNAYKKASSLQPEHLLNQLFIAECCYVLGDKKGALEACETIKNHMVEQNAQKLDPYVKSIESLI